MRDILGTAFGLLVGYMCLGWLGWLAALAVIAMESRP
jgi:hypothetical protein